MDAEISVYNDMDDEVNIYADIDHFDLGEEIEKLKQEKKQLQEHVTSLEKDIEKLNSTVNDLKENQDTLTKNMSSLFLTAKAEIERKNRMIEELRAQAENNGVFNSDTNARKRKAREDSFLDSYKHKKFKFEDGSSKSNVPHKQKQESKCSSLDRNKHKKCMFEDGNSETNVPPIEKQESKRSSLDQDKRKKFHLEDSSSESNVLHKQTQESKCSSLDRNKHKKCMFEDGSSENNVPYNEKQESKRNSLDQEKYKKLHLEEGSSESNVPHKEKQESKLKSSNLDKHEKFQFKDDNSDDMSHTEKQERKCASVDRNKHKKVQCDDNFESEVPHIEKQGSKYSYHKEETISKTCSDKKLDDDHRSLYPKPKHSNKFCDYPRKDRYECRSSNSKEKHCEERLNSRGRYRDNAYENSRYYSKYLRDRYNHRYEDRYDQRTRYFDRYNDRKHIHSMYRGDDGLYNRDYSDYNYDTATEARSERNWDYYENELQTNNRSMHQNSDYYDSNYINEETSMEQTNSFERFVHPRSDPLLSHNTIINTANVRHDAFLTDARNLDDLRENSSERSVTPMPHPEDIDTPLKMCEENEMKPLKKRLKLLEEVEKMGKKSELVEISLNLSQQCKKSKCVQNLPINSDSAKNSTANGVSVQSDGKLQDKLQKKSTKQGQVSGQAKVNEKSKNKKVENSKDVEQETSKESTISVKSNNAKGTLNKILDNSEVSESSPEQSAVMLMSLLRGNITVEDFTKSMTIGSDLNKMKKNISQDNTKSEVFEKCLNEKVKRQDSTSDLLKILEGSSPKHSSKKSKVCTKTVAKSFIEDKKIEENKILSSCKQEQVEVNSHSKKNSNKSSSKTRENLGEKMKKLFEETKSQEYETNSALESEKKVEEITEFNSKGRIDANENENMKTSNVKAENSGGNKIPKKLESEEKVMIPKQFHNKNTKINKHKRNIEETVENLKKNIEGGKETLKNKEKNAKRMLESQSADIKAVTNVNKKQNIKESVTTFIDELKSITESHDVNVLENYGRTETKSSHENDEETEGSTEQNKTGTRGTTKETIKEETKEAKLTRYSKRNFKPNVAKATKRHLRLTSTNSQECRIAVNKITEDDEESQRTLGERNDKGLLYQKDYVADKDNKELLPSESNKEKPQIENSDDGEKDRACEKLLKEHEHAKNKFEKEEINLEGRTENNRNVNSNENFSKTYSERDVLNEKLSGVNEKQKKILNKNIDSTAGTNMKETEVVEIELNRKCKKSSSVEHNKRIVQETNEITEKLNETIHSDTNAQEIETSEMDGNGKRKHRKSTSVKTNSKKLVKNIINPTDESERKDKIMNSSNSDNQLDEKPNITNNDINAAANTKQSVVASISKEVNKSVAGEVKKKVVTICDQQTEKLVCESLTNKDKSEQKFSKEAKNKISLSQSNKDESEDAKMDKLNLKPNDSRNRIDEVRRRIEFSAKEDLVNAQHLDGTYNIIVKEKITDEKFESDLSKTDLDRKEFVLGLSNVSTPNKEKVDNSLKKGKKKRANNNGEQKSTSSTLSEQKTLVSRDTKGKCMKDSKIIIDNECESTGKQNETCNDNFYLAKKDQKLIEIDNVKQKTRHVDAPILSDSSTSDDTVILSQPDNSKKIEEKLDKFLENYMDTLNQNTEHVNRAFGTGENIVPSGDDKTKVNKKKIEIKQNIAIRVVESKVETMDILAMNNLKKLDISAEKINPVQDSVGESKQTEINSPSSSNSLIDKTLNSDRPIRRRRITPTPVRDDKPICTFKNILTQSNSFTVSNTSPLQLTHEGEIPVLHLDENHINNLPTEANMNDNIMNLLDTMNISNIDCEIPKFKNGCELAVNLDSVDTSNTLNFENIMKTVTSTPVVSRNEKQNGLSSDSLSNTVINVSSDINNSVSSNATAGTGFQRRRRRCRLIIRD